MCPAECDQQDPWKLPLAGALHPPHSVSGEPRLGGCTVHFADEPRGVQIQEDSCWGLSLGTLQGLHANEPPLGLFCKRQGADTPTLRIYCAPPPTDPVELARKWEEQVTAPSRREAAAHLPLRRAEWEAGACDPILDGDVICLLSKATTRAASLLCKKITFLPDESRTPTSQQLPLVFLQPQRLLTPDPACIPETMRTPLIPAG